MAYVPSLEDINNMLGVDVVNNYIPEILEHLHLTDPYEFAVPVGLWDPTRGLSQTQVRSVGELPTAFPGAGTALAQNDGSDNADLTPTTIKFGRTTRAYTLAGWAFNTDTYQVSDFQHNFQALDFVESQQALLREYQLQFMADWKRENLVGNIDNKVSITGSGSNEMTIVSNATARFGGFDALYGNYPAAPLDWGHLDTIYRDLIRRGAHKYAVGRDAGGKPVFTLVAGLETIQDLFRDSDLVREQVKYFDPKMNLSANGISTAVNGFVPVVDHFAPRFKTNAGNDGFTPVYPFVNGDISSGGSGRRSSANVAYRPVGAASGTATCEAFYVLPANVVMQMHVRPPVGTAWSMQQYGNQNYSGDIQWINNKDMSLNPTGDKGFYLMRNFLAAKPGKTDMAYCGLQKLIV